MDAWDERRDNIERERTPHAAMKRAAQTASGSGGRPPEQDENERFLKEFLNAPKPIRLSRGW